jgi:hypothetical protein
MNSHPAVRCRKRIQDVRCPATKGLPDDTYHTLHRSFVEILKMRRSIERADAYVEQSWDAIFDTLQMLKRLQIEGF